MRSVAQLLFSALVSAMVVGAASAAPEYPSRLITLVVPFSAGGAVDVVARVLGDYASRTLGQPVVVENVTGCGRHDSGGSRRARCTRRLHDPGRQSGYPRFERGELQEFIVRSTARFCTSAVANAPEVLLINKELPCQTLQDFVTYSKSNERDCTFGPCIGSISHLAYLLFRHLSNANFVMVPYAGDPQADLDLIAGRLWRRV